jgi:hypothetical protein
MGDTHTLALKHKVLKRNTDMKGSFWSKSYFTSEVHVSFEVKCLVANFLDCITLANDKIPLMDNYSW